MYLLDSVMSIGEALNVSITGIVVVFIVLVVLAVLVQLLSKLIRLFVKEPNAKNAKKSDAVKEVVKPQDGVALPENQTLGTLNLYKTDEKTAAVIMAIVIKESGVPLSRLKFNSIKLIENK